MHEQIKLECYIEEYRNQKNFLSARLRDKKTNKKVVLVGENLDKNHLLRFLSQAKLNQDIMPTIYEHLTVNQYRDYLASSSCGNSRRP